jgi:hypothetical protein
VNALPHTPTPRGRTPDSLGADAVLVDGTVRLLWRPRSPDDRPPAAQVVAAAVSLLPTVTVTEKGREALRAVARPAR